MKFYRYFITVPSFEGRHFQNFTVFGQQEEIQMVIQC